MIKMNIKITADTEEHLKKVIKDINRTIKYGNKYSECWYIYPNTYYLIERTDTDDNITA